MTGEKVDGRRERSKRTHAAIVEALTQLLDEGRIEPTAVEIAERAGVAVRSIAQHHTHRLEHETVDPRAPLARRLEAFVAERSRELESSRAMRGAAAVVLQRSPSVAEALQRVAERRRAETARVFAVEIAAGADPKATERSVALVTSGRAWDALRAEMGLGVKAARDQLAATLHDLLGR